MYPISWSSFLIGACLASSLTTTRTCVGGSRGTSEPVVASRGGAPHQSGKSRPLRWKLSKLPPIGCRSENGRGIAPRRNPSRATHLEAFRKLWSGRPDEILGRRARMHHAGLHLPRTSGVRFGFTSSSSSRLATRKRTSGKVSPRVPPRWDETGTARVRLAKGLWWQTARVDRSVDLACALGARMPRASSSTVFSFGGTEFRRSERS